MKKTRMLSCRERYKLLQWLPRAIACAKDLKLDKVPPRFTPDEAFIVFGFTGDRYHEHTREALLQLAITPTHMIDWYETFVARFRLEATCSELGLRDRRGL